jgi:hypothetical protein
MAIKNDREYRNIGLMSIETRAEGEEPSFIVEGYASTFDEYELFEWDGVKYFERIEPTAFEHTDMADVVFLIDHEGRVYARTKNGSVVLTVDGHGLYTRTDLGLTAASREVYEDVKVGNYSQMSFAFTVDEDEFIVNEKEQTALRVIKSIRKLYDISAVSFPANPNTDIGIAARDLFHGAMEKELAERLAREKRAKEIEALKLRLQMARRK